MSDKSKNNLRTLRKHLKGKTQKELIDEIAWLYRTFDSVREHYQASVFGDDPVVLKKYKERIEYEFFPKSWRQDPPARISVARKAVSDYKKVCCSPASMADIMLFYIETIMRYTQEYNDFDATLFSSVLSMYKNALDHIHNNELSDSLKHRLRAIVTDSVDLSDWLCSEMADLFDSYIDDEDY